jgi:hypothetical protein
MYLESMVILVHTTACLATRQVEVKVKRTGAINIINRT